jgi:ribosomal protein L44E
MVLEKIEKLRRRYDECDSQGHLKPDKSNNYCNHCYRHMAYSALDSHKSNIPQLARKNRELIRIQQRIDYDKGLKRLEGEL